MSYKPIAVSFAIIIGVFGVLFVVIAPQMFEFFGLTHNAMSNLASRDFGGAYIALAIVVFFLRNVDDACVVGDFALALAIGTFVSLAIMMYAIFTSAMIDNIPAWLTAVAYVVYIILWIMVWRNPKFD